MKDSQKYIDLTELAKEIRRETFALCHRAKHGHLGSAFSIIDIITALYFNYLSVNPKKPDDPNRDRFILSKGHAAASLYVTLQKRGFFQKKELDSFLQNGTVFAGHTKHEIPGIELSTGSLGHGLSVGLGMAYAAKFDKKPYKTVVLLSDGECDEGSTWEAILSAGHHKLDNLIAIVDYNKIQSFGRIKEVLDLEPFSEKWKSFGWAVREINGHNMQEILTALNAIPFQKGKPNVILAHTIKGKGVSFMEDTIDWHYWTPTDEHLKKALNELI